MSDIAPERDDLSIAYTRIEADLDAAHAKIAAIESALGTAQAEITRLEEAMRHAARGISIRSARKRIREALGE